MMICNRKVLTYPEGLDFAVRYGPEFISGLGTSSLEFFKENPYSIYY